MSGAMAGGSMSGAARGIARGADDWVERVRAASDIVEIVRQTVSLKRVGRNWTGLCPFHKEKTPSFSVHAERQFYHCFSCKAGGDVFKFVQETEKVGFLEAVELLSRRAGIPVPEARGGGAERGIKGRLLEALEAATTAYEQWLGDPSAGASARAYLERRGLTRDTIRGFRLGLAPAGWENLTQRLRERVPGDILVQAGLAAPRGGEEGRPARGGIYDRFRNRLMVPLVAPGGAVVGFGARALADEDQPKYLNSPETPVYRKGGFLFALEPARRKVTLDDEMIVVEGYFDAIALHQAGLTNCVATSGTALTADQARLLRRLVGRVALTYDGDAAGRDATMRSLSVLLGEGLDVVVVDLPQGEDPDSLVRKGGSEAWHEARRRAADPAEFVQRHVLRATAGGPTGVDPRERALQAVVTLGASVQDPVRVKILFERAAELLGVAEAVLERGLALRRSGQSADRPLAAAARDRRELGQGLERLLLRALLQAPAARDEVKGVVEPGDFRDATCAAVARWLWSGAEGLPDEDAAAALARELALAETTERDWSAEARGAARLIKVRRLREQKLDREQELRRAGTDPDTERRLSREIYEIARTMKNLSESPGEAGT